MDDDTPSMYQVGEPTLPYTPCTCWPWWVTLLPNPLVNHQVDVEDCWVGWRNTVTERLGLQWNKIDYFDPRLKTVLKCKEEKPGPRHPSSLMCTAHAVKQIKIRDAVWRNNIEPTPYEGVSVEQAGLIFHISWANEHPQVVPRWWLVNHCSSMIYGKAMLQAFPNNYLPGSKIFPLEQTTAPPEPMAWAHPYWLLKDLTVTSQRDQGETKSMKRTAGSLHIL